MSRTVFCHKLQKEAPGLTIPPYPGEIGQRIYREISEQAWQEWQQHQTMLINEYRLSMIDPKAREFLQTEMQKYLFEGGAAKPEGYVPTQD